MRTLLRVGAIAAALATMAVAAAPVAASGAPASSATGVADPAATPPTARSVLLLSLPALSWADLRGAAAPNLKRLLATSAVADLSTRSIRQRTTPANGYTALGAGARALADDDVAGQNLEPTEPYGTSQAGEVYTRRTGRPDPTAVGVLGIAPIVDANDAQPYDAVPGELGRVLKDAGIERRVIANADQDELAPAADQLHREAVLGLMDQTGRVRGDVGPDLLRRDPTAPFGLRLDEDRVLRAFAGFGARRTVTLVEASDLARADAYRPFATSTQRVEMRTRAIEDTDRLVSRLLHEVDLARDAVVVVGPYHSRRQRELTIAAVHAPGVAPGYLESSTTRRPGFVQVVDIAPTVLDLLGIERPEAMEGRPVEATSGSHDFEGRMRFLVRANREAVFRDRSIGTATVAVVATTIILTLGAVLALRARVRRAHPPLAWVAFGLLGFLIGTFVAGALPFDRWGTGAFFGFLVAWSVGFAAVCLLIGRRDPVDGLLVALGAIVGLHLVDLLTGAHLELNTVFGYTATVGIRVAGAGNPGSAQLCSAALLLATLLAWRVGGRRGVGVAAVLLAIVLVVVGAPFFGQDFGGAISLAPAALLLLLLLSGRRVSLRSVGWLVLALVVAGLAVGFVDLSRPADSRTHVGRFFEKVGHEGISGFVEVIGRKLDLMVRTFSNTGWVLVVVVAVGALVYVLRATDLFERMSGWVTTLRAGFVAFALLVVLATLLNDSGVQVTGMMTAIFVPTFVVLGCRASTRATPPARGQMPARSVSQPRI